MAVAKVVVDDNKKMKKSIEVKGWKRKWAVIGAVVVLLVAVSLTLKHDRDHKSCQCSQVPTFFPFRFPVVQLSSSVGEVIFF